MKKLLIFLLSIIVISCSDEYFENNEVGEGIAIYIVKDEQIDYSQNEVDIESLELVSTPWLKNSEIDYYDWSSHMFYLNVEKNKRDLSGKYFVVKSGDTRLFLGYFSSPYSSSLSYFPTITAWEGFYSEKILDLGGFGGFYKDDMNENIRFQESLQKAGLLKEGIEVELTRVEKQYLSVNYSFKVTNLESDNIYVLDPDKMDTKHFHYFTNGVSFSKNNESFYPDFQSESPGGLQKSWFYRLRPGDEMERTVTLPGFSELPSGVVKCRLSFPGFYPYGSSWLTHDGRYWLGNYWINTELVLE